MEHGTDPSELHWSSVRGSRVCGANPGGLHWNSERRSGSGSGGGANPGELHWNSVRRSGANPGELHWSSVRRSGANPGELHWNSGWLHGSRSGAAGLGDVGGVIASLGTWVARATKPDGGSCARPESHRPLTRLRQRPPPWARSSKTATLPKGGISGFFARGICCARNA